MKHWLASWEKVIHYILTENLILLYFDIRWDHRHIVLSTGGFHFPLIFFLKAHRLEPVSSTKKKRLRILRKDCTMLPVTTYVSRTRLMGTSSTMQRHHYLDNCQAVLGGWSECPEFFLFRSRQLQESSCWLKIQWNKLSYTGLNQLMREI